MALSALSTFGGSRPRSFLRPIYCHYVFDDQRDAFRALLQSLLEDGSFVDTDTCVAMLEGQAPITGKNYHLSFDDGFRNLLTNAAPVLRELGIPALAFVPTAYLGGDWETSHYFCREATNYGGVVQLMSWLELRELRESGVEIGSHTRTHPRLSDLSGPEELRAEIVDSKQEIEDQLGSACNYISWPFGSRGDVRREALDLIAQSGYKACFGGFRGRVEPGVTDRWAVPRHHFEPHWPLAHVRYFAGGGLETGSAEGVQA